MNTITSPEKQGFRDFDLPKEHLLNDRHYIPPKTYDEVEASRRRELGRGTLLAESQRSGLVVARRILENVTEQEGLMFATHMLAVAGLNTAWYSYAQNSSVMRRRLKLPIMAHKRAHQPEAVIDDAKDALSKQIARADMLVTATDLRLHTESDHQRRLGVGVGNLSLRLAMFEPVLNGNFDFLDDNDERAQALVRSECLSVLEEARTAHRAVGSHPSIAQLSDPYSHLSVFWHRNAPGSAQSAVVDALAG